MHSARPADEKPPSGRYGVTSKQCSGDAGVWSSFIAGFSRRLVRVLRGPGASHPFYRFYRARAPRPRSSTVGPGVTATRSPRMHLVKPQRPDKTGEFYLGVYEMTQARRSRAASVADAPHVLIKQG